LKLPAGQITDFASRPKSVKGKMIGAPDLMTGAIAISLGLKVVTFDLKDFEKTPPSK